MVLNTMTFRDLDPAIALTFVVQVSCLHKQSLEQLLVDYPLARVRIWHATFKLAFCRAVVQVAKMIAKNRARGVDLSILDAFSGLRKGKERMIQNAMRSKEPTSRLLASNLVDLSERTEQIAKQSQSRSDELAKSVSALDEKLDALFSALGVAAPAPAGAPAASGGWFADLMGGTPAAADLTA